MSRPRVIIADTDEQYIIPFLFKFINEFFEQIDFEIITDREYFSELFMRPQKAAVLIISDSMYQPDLKKHNISKVFILTEQYEENNTSDLDVVRIFKYTSIKTVFGEIIGKCAEILDVVNSGKKDTQIIMVTSANGGTGKTTVAIGLSAALAQNYKRVLYVNATNLQSFSHMLDNSVMISEPEVYVKLSEASDSIYYDIKHVVNREVFDYLPPFKAVLLSLGLSSSIFCKIVTSVQRSRDYDYIIVDSEAGLSEDKAELMELANKVIFITNQSVASVHATNLLVSNINGIHSEKYCFLCNNSKLHKEQSSLCEKMTLKYSECDCVKYIDGIEDMSVEELCQQETIAKLAYLVM